MPVIVRQYEGTDLVVPRAALAQLGLEPGQYVAIRPMARVNFIVTVEPAVPAQQLLELAWSSDDGEQVDAECAREEVWVRWARGGR